MWYLFVSIPDLCTITYFYLFLISDTKAFDGNACMNTAMYWSVLAILIFIIMFEICVLAIFVRKQFMLYTD